MSGLADAVKILKVKKEFFPFCIQRCSQTQPSTKHHRSLEKTQKIMKIELINDHKKFLSLLRKGNKKLIDVVLKKIGFEELENGQINIKYTSEEEIKMLNEKFYNKVGGQMSWLLPITKKPESKERLIGEIAICISQIEKSKNV